ncbi:MAG: hypothetical protein VCA34_10100, partial [Roseibacillus sp.]
MHSREQQNSKARPGGVVFHLAGEETGGGARWQEARIFELGIIVQTRQTGQSLKAQSNYENRKYTDDFFIKIC